MPVIQFQNKITVSIPEYQVFQMTNPLTGQDWLNNVEAEAWMQVEQTALASKNAIQMTAPPSPPIASDPRLWWIDEGPFKDRLGADGLALGASDNGICRTVIVQLSGRKYVDLKEAKTANMLDLLIATNQPTANPVFAGSGPMTTAKKNTILNAPTTEFERHIKGLVS